jgi:hypothetical protein
VENPLQTRGFCISVVLSAILQQSAMSDRRGALSWRRGGEA